MNTLQAFVLSFLLNSLWQVPLVFVAAWLAARIAGRSGPATEHRIWVTALVLEALLPACALPSTACLDSLSRYMPWNWLTHTVNTDARITILSGTGYAHSQLQLPPHLLAAIAIAYLACVLYFAARLFWSLEKTRSLQQHATPLDLSGSAASTWTRCCIHFNLRNAHIATSSQISSPVTVGMRRRLLLLPSSLPPDLLTEDLNAALAHECAHMHRRDFAKNLFYTAVALPIAYHPLLWLTRTHLAETREMVCDSMAAETLEGPHRYAHSLLRLASLFARTAPDRTLNAIGIFDANIFERRVMNLTHKPTQLRGTRRLATAAACVAIAFGTCASALALRLNVASLSLQSDEPSASTPKGILHIPGRVISGNRINFVQPTYPQNAKEEKLNGTIILDARIGKNGKIEKLRVVSGPEEFRKSAFDAVKQWTYKPYLLNGQPTVVDTTITVNYSLASNSAPTPDQAPAASGGSGPVADSNASGQPTHPVFISGPQPEYPANARADKNMLNGTVVVSLTVDTDGVPSNVSVVKNLRVDFDQSAVKAVKQYRFKPALLHGRPVDYPLTIDVDFQRF